VIEKVGEFMAKKNKEELCPDCDVPLDDDGNCPSCGWTKGGQEQEEKESDEDFEEEEDEEEGEEF
jgi:uncharacterized Zn finger protein (UPF0148 family)